MADHQNEMALQYSEKALKALADDPQARANPALADGIRQSAKDKIDKLKAK